MAASQPASVIRPARRRFAVGGLSRRRPALPSRKASEILSILPESGVFGVIHYYGYRYYHPELGRWISRDPIGEDGGLNLYAYINNNGINLNDYLGLTLEADQRGQELLDELSKIDDRLKKMIDEIKASENPVKIICFDKIDDLHKAIGEDANGRYTGEAKYVALDGYKRSRDGSGGGGQGGTIYAYCGKDLISNNECYRSAQTVVAHELQHAWDMATTHGQVDERGRYIEDENGLAESEKRAVRTENIVRENNNIKIRTHYNGTPVDNPGGDFSPQGKKPLKK